MYVILDNLMSIGNQISCMSIWLVNRYWTKKILAMAIWSYHGFSSWQPVLMWWIRSDDQSQSEMQAWSQQHILHVHIDQMNTFFLKWAAIFLICIYHNYYFQKAISDMNVIKDFTILIHQSIHVTPLGPVSSRPLVTYGTEMIIAEHWPGPCLKMNIIFLCKWDPIIKIGGSWDHLIS